MSGSRSSSLGQDYWPVAGTAVSDGLIEPGVHLPSSLTIFFVRRLQFLPIWVCSYRLKEREKQKEEGKKERGNKKSPPI